MTTTMATAQRAMLQRDTTTTTMAMGDHDDDDDNDDDDDDDDDTRVLVEKPIYLAKVCT